MSGEEKLQWIRDNWSVLEKKNLLITAITRLKEQDRSLDNFSVQFIIDLETSAPDYLK